MNVAARTPMRSVLHLASFAGLGLAACGVDVESTPDAEPVARATWYQDVAPILAKHCLSCHSAGGIAPFELTEYDAVTQNAARMLHQIDIGAMPPFDAREEADCTPRFGWVDDPRLSIAEKSALKAWVEDDFPLGTVAEIPKPPSIDLANISMSLAPAVGHAASGSRDQFICYILDPGITQPIAWLTGLQVRPDVDEVVHHAAITEVFAGPEQDALVAAHGIGVPFECAAATPADYLVNIWTPGNQPMQTKPEIAVPLGMGAKLVMQIHYHPAGVAHPADRTAIDLRLSTVWPRKMYFVTAFGNEPAAPNLLPGPGDSGAPVFQIPANAAAHPEHMRVTIPNLGDAADVRVFSANPHMHLVGTHISTTIERPAARGTDPKTECLANGAWNFDWQRTYIYDAPLDRLPSVAEGDVIDIKCTWNNTIDNPFVQRMLADSNLPPRPVELSLGEQTADEMCLEIVGLSINAPPQPSNRDAPVVLPNLDRLKLARSVRAL